MAEISHDRERFPNIRQRAADFQLHRIPFLFRALFTLRIIERVTFRLNVASFGAFARHPVRRRIWSLKQVRANVLPVVRRRRLAYIVYSWCNPRMASQLRAAAVPSGGENLHTYGPRLPTAHFSSLLEGTLRCNRPAAKLERPVPTSSSFVSSALPTLGLLF